MKLRKLCFAILLCCSLQALEVSGVVVSASSGKPIGKADVAIGMINETPIHVFTDSDGKFTVQDLQPGSYLIFASASGYVRKQYNSVEASTLGPPLRIDASTPTPSLTIRLTPTSVIRGRIVDPDGDPLEWVTVYAFRELRRNGAIELSPPIATQNDTEGNYRLTGLAPGRYRLLARGGRWLPGQNKQFDAAWYPRTIQIRTGDQLDRIDISMNLEPVHQLRGRLIAPAGDEAKMYSIQLIPRGTPPAVLSVLNTPIRYRGSTGEFESDDVVAGAYTLQAIREDMHTREVALRLDLNIYSDQKDLLLGPRPLAAIAGRIEMAKGSPTLDIETMRISIHSRDSDFAPSVRPIPVRSDGSFEVYNLAFAKYRFTAQDATGRMMVLENPNLDLSATQPNPFVLRILAPEPTLTLRPARSTASFLTTLTGDFINFTLEPTLTMSLPPGRHWLLTCEDTDFSRFDDPAFIEKLKAFAKLIDVKLGENLDLEVPTLSYDEIQKLHHPL